MQHACEVIAHRGASSLCPENTRAAVLKAVELGVDAVELDVRLTQDGAWVVIHEEEISQRSDGKGMVESMTLDQLRQYDFGSWFAPDFRGEKILTVEEAMELVLPRATLILDIKTEDDASKLAKSLYKTLPHAHKARVLFSSFSADLLRALRRLDQELLLGYLFRRWPRWNTWLAGREFFYSVHPRKDVFSRELAAFAHERNLKVFVWTVNRPEEMEKVATDGADGCFTDFPQRASKHPV